MHARTRTHAHTHTLTHIHTLVCLSQVVLPRDAAAAKTVVGNLQESFWIDEQTRVVFVEVSFYNPNIDQFATVKYNFEVMATGGVVTSSSLDAAPLLQDLRAMRVGSAVQRTSTLARCNDLLKPTKPRLVSISPDSHCDGKPSHH